MYEMESSGDLDRQRLSELSWQHPIVIEYITACAAAGTYLCNMRQSDNTNTYLFTTTNHHPLK